MPYCLGFCRSESCCRIPYRSEVLTAFYTIWLHAIEFCSIGFCAIGLRAIEWHATGYHMTEFRSARTPRRICFMPTSFMPAVLHELHSASAGIRDDRGFICRRVHADRSSSRREHRHRACRNPAVRSFCFGSCSVPGRRLSRFPPHSGKRAPECPAEKSLRSFFSCD